ncbi:MAG: 50S ribosomal protein L15 [Bacilli bacterium]
MKLENLKYVEGSRNHKEKRVGRGFGSGMGKTCTRGSKGQHARKSGGTRPGFEGGQNPLYRRIPKIGFNNENFKTEYNVISLQQIVTLGLTKIDSKILLEKRIFSNEKLPLKIIGNMSLTKPLDIKASKFSKGAISSLEKSKSNFSIINSKI